MGSRRELANAVRALSMDAVERAQSGHPGMPMGMADIAEVLWNDHLSHSPSQPDWIDRDRFVLSNGHGSMLLYSVLHLSGYDLPIEELKNFRQLHAKTPGHPERGYAPGVETTTGPLGQGLANAVGMALAERTLAARFNQPGHEIIDHMTYVFLGDGCLMEGISHEACSFAGTLALGKLVAVYDDNGISIDGKVGEWFSDDTPSRFEAYGWHVIRDVDGHDAAAIDAALRDAKADTGRPSLICAKTIIGWGSPNKAGSESSHGAPLGEGEVADTRAAMGWTHAPFVIPDPIYQGWDARERGEAAVAGWEAKFDAYRAAHPTLAAELERTSAGHLPVNWSRAVTEIIADTAERAETVATRKASQTMLEAIAPLAPELIGGSADLTGSNLTNWSGSVPVSDRPEGNYIYYGVREFAMAAIMNGLALHGGLIPYGGTFLIFSEYARNALRMAALMKIGTIYVFTHDSIGLGEDGPTHQAVEQAGTLRLLPNMSVWRPCDAVETAVAWRHAVERRTGPTSLLLSRQGLAHVSRTPEMLAGAARGGYVIDDCEGVPEVLVIATGSEVELAIKAARKVRAEGTQVRVVSMPSTDVFDAQDADYRESVLPNAVRARLAVEAGVGDYWGKYVGLDGAAIGVDTFGESAPAKAVFEHFGFEVDNVAEAIRALGRPGKH